MDSREEELLVELVGPLQQEEQDQVIAVLALLGMEGTRCAAMDQVVEEDTMEEVLVIIITGLLVLAEVSASAADDGVL